MRIRKHAARILSSLSIPTQSLAAAAAAAAAAAGDRELEMHVCQLNQSPWDAMDFTPPGSVSFFPYGQELEEVDEEYNSFAWSGHTEEQEAAAAAAAVSDVSGITAAESTLARRQVKVEVIMAEQAAEGEEGAHRERRREYCYAKRRSNSSNGNITKKTKRKSTSSHAAGAAEDETVKIKLEIPPPAAATPAATCKKSDGKGWHCKRPAQHPHSLCEYHLNQVRSYYGHALHHQQAALPKAQDAALIPDNKRKNKKKKTTTTAKKGSNSGRGHKSSDRAGASRKRWKPEADFFYYYSGFGPWRGKRRCGGADSDRGYRWSSSINVEASNGDDVQREAAPAPHGAPSPTVHDQAPDDLDDDDEDIDGGDDVRGRDGGDDVAPGRRRARKPIKARSLKSLL